MPSKVLLRAAISLVPKYGFSREALARSVVAASPLSSQKDGSVTENDAADLGVLEGKQLSDTAVTALFGKGNAACKTLFQAWLEEGIHDMHRVKDDASSQDVGRDRLIQSVLLRRLEWNQPVLQCLPSAFSTWTTTATRPELPASIMSAIRNPGMILSHTLNIADEACAVSGDQAVGLEWYARRARLAAAYGLAEVHQLAATSPDDTSYRQVLVNLIERSESASKSFEEANLYSRYVLRSMQGIVRSSGVFY